MPKKAKRFSYSAGRRPFTVGVDEVDVGGNYSLRIWLKREQKYRYRSLGHRDKRKAIEQAEKMASRLREGAEAVFTGRLSLLRLFRLYRAHRSPRKGKGEQVEDERRIELFERFFGEEKNLHSISLHDFEAFAAARQSGTIESHGQLVAEDYRKPVRAGTAAADLAWLSGILSWGTKWKTHEGEYLLKDNPVRGYELPRERNPRRPVVTEDRYEKVLEAAPQVTMQLLWGEKFVTVPSYLPELLILANVLAGGSQPSTASPSLIFAST